MTRFAYVTTVVVFLSAAFAAYAGGNEIKLEARMNLGEAAEAKGSFESRDGRSRLSVEVEGTANARIGGTVLIEIGGFRATVAYDPVDDNFDLNLDTSDGDSVPPVAAGDVVRISDGATGAPLLAGVFTAK